MQPNDNKLTSELCVPQLITILALADMERQPYRLFPMQPIRTLLAEFGL